MVKHIEKNTATCPSCGDILVTTHNYDFKHCQCGILFVDGIDVNFRIGLAGEYADQLKTNDFTILGVIG